MADNARLAVEYYESSELSKFPFEPKDLGFVYDNVQL